MECVTVMKLWIRSVPRHSRLSVKIDCVIFILPIICTLLLVLATHHQEHPACKNIAAAFSKGF